MTYYPYVLFIVIGASSCKHEIEDLPLPHDLECSSITIDFEKDVLPIFASNCAFTTCHAYPANEGGINLTGYSKIVDAVNEAPILQAIKREDVEIQFMPANSGKLDQSKIDIIECWIQAGMPE